jgi:hypothetical protein
VSISCTLAQRSRGLWASAFRTTACTDRGTRVLRGGGRGLLVPTSVTEAVTVSANEPTRYDWMASKGRAPKSPS